MTGDFERTLPHDIAAEQCTLGGMLLSRNAIADVADVMRAGDHYRPGHQIIHETIAELDACGEPVDAVTVADALARRGELARAGGAPYLHTLIASVPTAANAGYYARIVRDRAILREVIESGTRAVQLAYQGDGDAAGIAERARMLMDGIDSGRGASGLPTQAELVDQVLDSLETDPEPGLPTGFTDLDEAITGMFGGELIIVGARPGVGKSVLGYGFATHAGVKLGVPVLFCSLEMSGPQLTERLIAAQAKVSLTRIRKHELDEADWNRVQRAHDRMTSSKVRIDDTPHASLGHIRSRLREMARTTPARLLVVDYLGLLAEPKGTEGRRESAVAALSRGLKLIAREFNIPVVALAQLNRNAEQRHDKRPQLADLRESGAQEQDADIVLLLHREDAYDRESARAGEIDVIVAKQRQGPQCTVTLAFQGHYARCVDMAVRKADEWTPSKVLDGAVA